MTRKRPDRKPDLSGLLGEGLGELKNRAPTAAAQVLPVASLRPGTQQPRRAFDDPALQALAASIQAEGILQPLLVRPVRGGHEIVAGERRWRAAQLAGLAEVPVFIRELDDRQALAAGLVENLQRQDLNVIDEVDAKLGLVALTLGLEQHDARGRIMQLLREEPGADHAALDALFAGLGEGWQGFAKNKLRVLNWPPALVDALRAGLPHTVAAVIAGAPETEHPRLIAVAEGGATRAELREEVARLTAPAPKATVPRAELAGRRLTSRRFMANLGADERKAVERWLAKMPAALAADE
ncbi:putative chromosome 2-partitioning protein ParB [Deinococcus malanensis]|uniref:Chromosome 2-partitioning protein ParB n=1 Tax=Deinococcus malanensis TaxID=1706855 RepID=A0ABQ2F1Z4_9DEIO|nr:ParB/RepB/Spo0J family partition protein [Deinococcus malanensis]GGK41799.1 putative chromosome 2-partitioning protein ParB [Deinococcus malanensis]